MHLCVHVSGMNCKYIFSRQVYGQVGMQFNCLSHNKSNLSSVHLNQYQEYQHLYPVLYQSPCYTKTCVIPKLVSCVIPKPVLYQNLYPVLYQNPCYTKTCVLCYTKTRVIPKFLSCVIPKLVFLVIPKLVFLVIPKLVSCVIQKD